ncbi:MAG: hypothetical protein M3N16_01795 [Actinomycetota bacterium]|nr:hypothetical protein [Actinomycetota bacterium]
MSSDDHTAVEEVRAALETAARWGRYAESGTPKDVKRLAGQGKFREAFDLVEGAAEARPREDFFWLSMKEVAAHLGLEERAAYYQGRYDGASQEQSVYLDRLFERIEAVVRSTCTVEEGMFRVIDFCSEARPHGDWRRFREQLNFDDDLRRLTDWLRTVFSNQPPPEEIDGLWFGLFEPVEDGEPTRDMDVAGGTGARNDPDRWAERLTWTPKAAHARSQVLHGIYQIAYDGLESDGWVEGLGNEAEHPLCLTYAGLAVRWLASTSLSELLLGRATERVIEVGFNDGDLLHLGTLTPEGWLFPEGGMVS